MIRYLEKDEKQNIRPLYEQWFNDGDAYTDYYFNERLSDNYVMVDEAGSEIVGAIHLIPQNVIVGKLKTDIIYIWCWDFKKIQASGNYERNVCKAAKRYVWGYGAVYLSNSI